MTEAAMTEPVRIGAAQRPLPDLGRVGYGGADLGNLYRPMNDDEAWAVLDAAWDSGIRYFDTAPHYGLGLSERRLGAFLATKPRSEYVLSTKVGRRLQPSPETAAGLDTANHYAVPASLRRVWDFSPDGVRRCLDDSLDRLGLDAVDVLFVHDPDESDDPARRDGRRGGGAGGAARGGSGRRCGGRLQVHGGAGGRRTHRVPGRRHGGRPLHAARAAGARRAVPPCARRSGSTSSPPGVFNSGLLAAPAPGPHAKYEYAEVPPDVLGRALRLEAVCAEYDVALPVAALQFVLRRHLSAASSSAAPSRVTSGRTSSASAPLCPTRCGSGS
jgi:D-threo-aldose 1-dehydrogenase